MFSGDTALWGAVLFGLASALHCGTMCGGIACGALMIFNPTTQRERAATLLIMQAGRVTTYMILGAIAAGIGSSIIAPAAAGHPKVLQWAAAVSLMWAGLATAGLLPRMVLVDQGMAKVADTLDRMTRPLRSVPGLAPYTIGLSWGLAACPVVYAALLTASFTGSPVRGAELMGAFGLGTVPAVVISGLGLSTLALSKIRHPVHVALGLVIAVFGFTSLYHPWPAIAGLCVTPAAH